MNHATLLARHEGEIVRLRSENEAMKEALNLFWIARARLNAENFDLRRDADRLTWLDESGQVDLILSGAEIIHCCGKHVPTLREAIDIAMAKESDT